MKASHIVISLVLFVVLVGTALLVGCSSQNSTKIKVMTSTSLMEYIVEQVGGNHVEVTNLVPPSQHPGNFDVKPGDIQNLAKAKLFLLHGWPGEGYADQLVAAANNPNLTVVKANVDGNWMIPSVQAAATDKVASVLSQVDPANAADYQKNAAAYKEKIQSVEKDVTSRFAAADVSSINVIASARQADFLQWAGFNVIDSFQSPDALTPQVIQTMIDEGKAQNVKLVINNLQDGKDAAKAIADELGVPDLNLSNFPGGYDNTSSWEKAIDYNVTLLLNTLK